MSMLLAQEAMDARSSQLRRMAFCSVALSTITVAISLVAFPVAFQYAYLLQTEVTDDVQYCRVTARHLWKEMMDMDTNTMAQPGSSPLAERRTTATTIMHDQDFFESAIKRIIKRQAVTDMICCTCHRGENGPLGSAGSDGRDGQDGLSGRPGNPGQPAANIDSPGNFPPQCPCESDGGPTGTPGNKGPPGIAGTPGEDGRPGNDGGQGEPGSTGPNGQPGSPGPKGPRGDAGGESKTEGPPGQPGGPGTPGNAGRIGTPGDPGQEAKPGSPGSPGEPGRRGLDGSMGMPGKRGPDGDGGPGGSCTHCPAARLAPGY